MTDIESLVHDCARYWNETGVPRKAVEEMTLELAHHLRAAEREGRQATAVVGPDVAEFAEDWAVERRRGRPRASWEDVMSGRTERDKRRRRELVAYGAGTAALVAAVAVIGKGANEVDTEIWRWLWTGLAVVMAIGEMFTAGFFLLPFSIGAACAAVLAWVGVGILPQWLIFFGVSAIALAYLRRYITRQDEGEQPRVGANRWIGSTGVVLEEIDPDTASGMVRVENEEWRAVSEHGSIIPAGSRIHVLSVRGARLVVEPYEN